jgi:hypothetical protein
MQLDLELSALRNQANFADKATQKLCCFRPDVLASEFLMEAADLFFVDIRKIRMKPYQSGLIFSSRSDEFPRRDSSRRSSSRRLDALRLGESPIHAQPKMQTTQQTTQMSRRAKVYADGREHL